MANKANKKKDDVLIYEEPSNYLSEKARKVFDEYLKQKEAEKKKPTTKKKK